MKYFGDYLVSKGLITREMLLAGLVEQADGLPSVLRVIWEQKLLTEEQFFQALDAQAREGLEFRHACMSLGLWNEAMDKKAQECLARHRIPFGQILVKKGVIDLTTLTRAFDEFLAMQNEQVAV